MKANLSRALICLGSLAICALVHADCGASGCWNVYVDEVYPEAQGGAWIKTSGDERLANCTADSGIYLRLSGTAAGFKEIYATLLAAQLSEKKVSIRITEGSNPCSITYVTLNRNNW